MVPAGKSDFLDKPTLAMLPEIVEALQRMVRTDWPEMDVIVQGVCCAKLGNPSPLCVYNSCFVATVSDDGLISITFPMDELESDFGVLAYMNTRANANGARPVDFVTTIIV